MKKAFASILTTMAAVFFTAAFGGVDGFISGTNFEKYNTGTNIVYNTTDDAEVLYTNVYWAVFRMGDDGLERVEDEELSPATVAAHSGGSGNFAERPAQYASDATNRRYMSFSTSGETLCRTINQSGSNNEGYWTDANDEAGAYGVDLYYHDDGGGTPSPAVYFDSMVQFFATDTDEPLTGADKFLLYLKGSEATGTTNLVIVAGIPSPDSSNKKIYVETNALTNVTIEEGSWHRLTIEATPAADNGDQPTFTFSVYVDGRKAKTSQGRSVFYSAQAAGDNYALTGVGFRGTGAVDEIAYSTGNPLDPTVTLSVQKGENVSSVTVNGLSGASYVAANGDVVINVGATVASGYKPYIIVDGAPMLLEQYSANPRTAAAFEDDGVISVVAISSVATVTLSYGGEEVPMTGLAEALEAIADESIDDATIVLLGDQTMTDGEGFIADVAGSLVIDLNGKTISCTVADAEASLWVLGGGSCTIVNSGSVEGGISAALGTGCAVYATSVSMTFGDGDKPDDNNFKIDGDLYCDPGMLSVFGGRYKAVPIDTNGDEFQSEDCAPAGYALKADGTGYYTLQAALWAEIDGDTELHYNGQVQAPTFLVKYGSAVLSSSDYTVAYSPSTVKDVGDYTATVSGLGDYAGLSAAPLAFSIVSSSLADATVTLTPESGVYTGAAFSPAIQLTIAGSSQPLVEDVDYTVGSWSGGLVDVGEYTVTLSAKDGGNFTGETTATFVIEPASIEDAVVTVNPPSAIYDGETTFAPVVQSVVLTLGGSEVTLVEDVDYTVGEWDGNLRDIGKYSVVITARDGSNFTGEVTAYFEVVEDDEPKKGTVDGKEYATSSALVDAARSGSTITVPDGWTVDISAGTVSDGTTVVAVEPFYTIKAIAGGYTLELNENAIPPLGEVVDSEGTHPPIEVSDTAFQVAIPTDGQNERLWYRLERYAALSDARPSAAGDWVAGLDGQFLTISKGASDSSGFYRIRATDIDPDPVQ